MTKKIILSLVASSLCWAALAEQKDEEGIDALVASYAYTEAPAPSSATVVAGNP